MISIFLPPEQPISIGGQRIDNMTLPQAAERVVGLAGGTEPSLVVTPNASHLRALEYSEKLRAAYAIASMRLADGMPLVWPAA